MEQNNNNNGNTSPKSNNTNLIIAGIAIIVVIAIAIAVPHLKRSSTVAAPTNDTSMTTPADTSSDNGTAAASMEAWNSLFQKYTGRLVVFAADCTTTPHTQAQAQGNTVLMMNNSTIPHTITVGGTSYAVGAYHYKTVMLNTAGNVLINCDAHNGVASITVK